MKRYIYIIAAILSVALAFTACESDCVDEPISTEGDVVITEYGESYTFTIAADLSCDVQVGVNLPEGEVELVMYDSNSEYKIVTAQHQVVDGVSTFTLDEPLLLGRHILHWARFSDSTRSGEQQFMLGMTLDVTRSENSTSETYNTLTRNSGDGTADSPYEVSSPANLTMLNEWLSSDDSYDTKGVYLKQVCDLNFFVYSISYSGFTGVCPTSNRPFRGVYDGQGFSIKNLSIITDRDGTGDSTTTPAGLFSHISGAVLKNINIEQPYIKGYNWVGSLVGAVMSETSLDKTYSYMYNCNLIESTTTVNSEIVGHYYVGGLVGGLDYQSGLYIYNCHNKLKDLASPTTISTFYTDDNDLPAQCGGLVGGACSYTDIFMSECSNDMDISLSYTSSVGGLIGGGYSVTMSNCSNTGDISSTHELATGGLVGGSVDFCGSGLYNEGDVDGYKSCGGILGSSAFDYSDGSFGNASIVSSMNMGDVQAYVCAGGIIGSGQTRVTDVYNEGEISAGDGPVGGIVGVAPVIVACNANNCGAVLGSGKDYSEAGGIVGYSYYYFITSCNNAGYVFGHYSSGGIIGTGGCIGSVDFSNNYGQISGSSKVVVGGIGGIVGELTREEENMVQLYFCDSFITAKAILAVSAEIAESVGKKALKDVLAKVVAAGDLLMVIKAIGEGTMEEIEYLEEGEEMQEQIEELNTEMAERSEEYSGKINSNMDDIISGTVDSPGNYGWSIKYYGEYNIDESKFTPLTLASQNSLAFCNYILSSTTIQEEYSEVVKEKQIDINEAEIEAKRIEEGIKMLIEIVVGIVAIATGLGLEATLLKSCAIIAACTSCEFICDKVDLYGDNALNSVLVTQCTNFGSVSGSGIVGTAGDWVVIKHVLSGAPQSHYSVADVASTEHQSFGSILVVGETSGVDPYNDYNGKDSSILDSSNDDYGEGKLSDINNYDNDFTNYNFWHLGTNYGFAMPSNSYYLREGTYSYYDSSYSYYNGK